MKYDQMSKLPADIPLTFGPVVRRPRADPLYLQWLDNRIFETWREPNRGGALDAAARTIEKVEQYQQAEIVVNITTDAVPYKSAKKAFDELKFAVLRDQVHHLARAVKEKYGVMCAKMLIRVHGGTDKLKDVPKERLQHLLSVFKEVLQTDPTT